MKRKQQQECNFRYNDNSTLLQMTEIDRTVEEKIPNTDIIETSITIKTHIGAWLLFISTFTDYVYDTIKPIIATTLTFNFKGYHIEKPFTVYLKKYGIDFDICPEWYSSIFIKPISFDKNTNEIEFKLTNKIYKYSKFVYENKIDIYRQGFPNNARLITKQLFIYGYEKECISVTNKLFHLCDKINMHSTKLTTKTINELFNKLKSEDCLTYINRSKYYTIKKYISHIENYIEQHLDDLTTLHKWNNLSNSIVNAIKIYIDNRKKLSVSDLATVLKLSETYVGVCTYVQTQYQTLYDLNIFEISTSSTYLYLSEDKRNMLIKMSKLKKINSIKDINDLLIISKYFLN